MGYDITYHPASKTDIQQAYFELLNDKSAKECQLNMLSPDEKQAYLDLIQQGKAVNNAGSFDTTHGYIASVALGFFHKYYYIRGSAFSFLFENYPYYRKYVVGWENILPKYDFQNKVHNEIMMNYSSGVYISPEGVHELWHDYHNNPITKLELDFYFDANIHQFLSALDAAREQNKGLLEASEVYSPFEGNFSLHKNLISKNETPFEYYPELSLEKQYFEAVNTIFNSKGKPDFTPLQQLKKTYPFPGKIEFALGWLKDVVGELPEAELHYIKAIELGFDNYITHHFFGEFYRVTIKDNQKAIAQYNLSLSKNPLYELNHIGIGDIAEAEKDWEAAKSAYEKAIEINPIQAEYHNNLGVYECKLFNYQQGIAHYRRAIQLSPSYLQAYENLAWELYRIKEYEESQVVALLALGKLGHIGTLYDVLGRASVKLGNIEQAINYFETSIQECPYYPATYCELSDIYDRDYEKALAIINQCIEKNPNYSFGYYKRAKKNSKLEKYQEAEEDFLTAISLGDNTANTYTSLGFVYCEGLKQPQKAINAFSKAIEIDPHYEIAHRNMAISYWDLGESEKALKKLDDALKLLPDSYAALLNKAVYLQKLKRYDESIIAYSNVLQYYPDNQKAHINIAYNYYDTKQYDKAIIHFKIILNTAPNHHNAISHTASCYYNLKDYKNAIAYYSQAIALNPADSRNCFNIGVCYENLGKKKEAINHYEKTLTLDANHEKAKSRLLKLKKRGRWFKF